MIGKNDRTNVRDKTKLSVPKILENRGRGMGRSAGTCSAQGGARAGTWGERNRRNVEGSQNFRFWRTSIRKQKKRIEPSEEIKIGLEPIPGGKNPSRENQEGQCLASRALTYGGKKGEGKVLVDLREREKGIRLKNRKRGDKELDT